MAGWAAQYDTLNNPYTLNLSRSAVRSAKATGAVDNPFTAAELERLLRVYDSDVGTLSPRLAALLDTTSVTASGINKPPLGASLQYLRRQVTTDSFDLPSPNLLVANTTSAQTLPTGILNPAPLALSAADLVLARISATEIGTAANPGPNQSFATNHTLSDPTLASTHSGWNNIPIQLQLMLPPSF